MSLAAKIGLNKNELDKLAAVIGEVETKTSGEIRLVLVRRSAVTGHVHTLLWSLLVSTSFLSIWFGRHDLIFWDRWWLWPSIVLAAFVLAELLARLENVQRFFTPYRDLHHQVWARAEVEFHREGLADTKTHTGVMIFVSLMERQALVLADKGISEKVPAGSWDEVVKTVIDGARNGRWAEQLEKALRECGKYLADHFPATGEKSNELSNEVIVKD